jgi:hypothetical protein
VRFCQLSPLDRLTDGIRRERARRRGQRPIHRSRSPPSRYLRTDADAGAAEESTAAPTTALAAMAVAILNDFSFMRFLSEPYMA